MTTRRPRSVLFVAAAGPRLGFGHLVRCATIARALGVAQTVALRGTPRTVIRARRLGWTVLPAGARRSLDAYDLALVDDPSARHAGTWVRAAHVQAVPVASVHDLGLAYVAADLTIDGSIRTRGQRSRADLAGPRFAILASAIRRYRHHPPTRKSAHVIVALGGGQHVRSTGVRLAAAIHMTAPFATIDLAAGFDSRSVNVPLPPRARWIDAPGGLARALATASVAVTAGGITAYEACALGTPVVAFPVTEAQRQTTAALAEAGAVIDVGHLAAERRIGHAASAVSALLAVPERRARLGSCGRRLVDGDGVFRVADRLRALARLETSGGRRRAA